MAANNKPGSNPGPDLSGKHAMMSLAQTLNEMKHHQVRKILLHHADNRERLFQNTIKLVSGISSVPGVLRGNIE